MYCSVATVLLLYYTGFGNQPTSVHNNSVPVCFRNIFILPASAILPPSDITAHIVHDWYGSKTLRRVAYGFLYVHVVNTKREPSTHA